MILHQDDATHGALGSHLHREKLNEKRKQNIWGWIGKYLLLTHYFTLN